VLSARDALFACLLVLAVTAVNAPTWDYGFVYDDHAVIEERKPAWEQGWKAFLQTRQWGTGRHAMTLSLDLNRTEPLSPKPFHIVNTALAAIATVLVFALARALGLSSGAALAGSLLFAVHPVHTDAVVSIVGRAEVLAAIAVLGCLLLHVRGYRPWPVGFVAAAPLLLLGLMSKESAFALVFLVALYDFFLAPPRSLRERALPYVAYAAATAAWLALVLPSLRTLDPVVFADNPLAYVTPWQRVAVASALLCRYLTLTVAPFSLKPDWSFAETDPTLAAGAVGLIAWAGAAIACWMLRRRAPLLAFSFAWFPAAFAVTGNVAFPLGTIMAERLLYLPSVGPCLLAALAFEHFAGAGRARRVLAVAATAAATLALAFAYDARGRVWTNDEHYHLVSVFDSPKSAKAHYDRGLFLAREKDYEGAEAEFKRALEILPSFSRAAYYLASTYTLRNRPEDAARVYAAYLEADPSDTGALSQLANLQLQLGRYKEARASALRLLELEPDSTEHKQLLTLVENREKKDQSLKASSSSGSR